MRPTWQFAVEHVERNVVGRFLRRKAGPDWILSALKERALGRRNREAATASNASSLSELTKPPSGVWNNYRSEWTDNLEAANAIGDGRSFPLGGADGR
jgi:hypothetical protein